VGEFDGYDHPLPTVFCDRSKGGDKARPLPDFSKKALTTADNKVYTWNIHLHRGNFMEITAKQLRIQPGRIIAQVNNGQEITITYRGKACAKIIPINAKKTINLDDADNELFGMWKDRNDMKDVEQYARNKRKGRKLC
jgi:prevent-host-death family protein